MCKKIILTLMISLFFCNIPVALAADKKTEPATVDAAGEETSANTAAEKLPYEDLRLFTEIFHQIRTNYVNEISDEELFEYAIRGMLSGLDPHSSYMNETEFAELQEATTGEFGGLGLEVIMENGFMKVISPIDDTPAQKAGILAGDIIVKIDNHAIKGMSLDDSINLMRGEKGSKVDLTIIRGNVAKPMNITLVRDIIRIASVKTQVLEKKYGYLRISQFQSNTADDVKAQLKKMLDANYNQIEGLIIDLRNNPGGLLQGAVQIADLFLNDGLIVYTEGRAADTHEEYRADRDSLFNGKPILVLINNGSASASEIVAGALQDHKRAIVAGTTSFGKGSVQVILPLPHNRGMKLTTARYYTPLGRSIQAEGIKPDITIQNAEITEQEETVQLKEADLAKHLENTKEKSEVLTEEKEKANEDYQLHEALNLLKAMNLSHSTKF